MDLHNSSSKIDTASSAETGPAEAVTDSVLENLATSAENLLLKTRSNTVTPATSSTTLQKLSLNELDIVASTSTIATIQTAADVQAQAPSDSTEDNERSCWICFATDEDNKLAAWVQPCKCRGTTKWVHQSCLYRWVDEKQKGNALRAVTCQQCQTEYIIVFPQMGKFANILEAFDNLIKRLSPFLAAGIFVGSLYWTAVTYGAVTFLQVPVIIVNFQF